MCWLNICHVNLGYSLYLLGKFWNTKYYALIGILLPLGSTRVVSIGRPHEGTAIGWGRDTAKDGLRRPEKVVRGVVEWGWLQVGESDIRFMWKGLKKLFFFNFPIIAENVRS